jgi:hypothetical protein
MSTPALLDCDELLAAWHRLIPNADFAQCHRYELDEVGQAVSNPPPSARRQIVLTDVYCHVTEHMGHLAAMSVAVSTRSFGIRVPDVVWMPCHRWEGFDRDEPLPFVPELCVEVLLDTDRSRDIDRRVQAYLAGGAAEVIVIGRGGEIEFWGAKGKRQASTFGITLPLDSMYFDEPQVSSIFSARC